MSVSVEVATLFLDELARRNVPVKPGDDGGYEIDVGGLKAIIRLENLSRDFIRDRDPARVSGFVDAILAGIQTLEWEAARPRIRWALEPAGMPLEDSLHDWLSDQVARVLVLVSADEARMTWVSPSMAEEWGQTKEAVFAAAAANMRWLLADASITFLPVEDHKLGMLNTAYDAFKAALVLSPRLKDLAEPVLGWPLFVVMPCRDFVYLIPREDQDILGRVGPTVMEEYNESAYPLCTEVFELTDAGLLAIGEFRRQKDSLENL